MRSGYVSNLTNDNVDKTKVGKGSKVIAAVDGNGLPFYLDVASAQTHELTLAKPSLFAVASVRAYGLGIWK